MTTEKQADLTIIRHDKTDGMISVYRGNRHLGQIYPLRWVVPPARLGSWLLRIGDYATAGGVVPRDGGWTAIGLYPFKPERGPYPTREASMSALEAAVRGIGG